MILEQLFVVTAVAGLTTTASNLIGANIYDLQAVKKRRHWQRHPYARQYRQRPLVTAVIETRNNQSTIEQCLTSLVRTSYRKLAIVIIDHASNDDTKALIKRFQAAHPKRSIRLVARRSATADTAAITASIKKYAHGDLILALDSSSQLDSPAISRAVRHFNLEPSIDILNFNCRVASSVRTVSLFQRYYEFMQYRSKKFASLSRHANEREAVSMYRSGLAPGIHSRSVQQIYYAADAIARIKPVSSFYVLLREYYRRQLTKLQTLKHRRSLPPQVRASYGRLLTIGYLLLNICRAITVLFVPVLLTYFMYLAVSLHEPSFLIVSWVLLGVLIISGVWANEQLKLTQKTIYSLLAPATYILFYLLSFVQILAVLRALLPQSNAQPLQRAL